MRFVQCKNCGKVYPASLKRCPDCTTKTPISTAKIVAGVTIILFGFGLLYSAATTWSDEATVASSKQASTSEQPQNSETRTEGKVNYKKFKKIENGMTYEQIVEIFGEEGEVLSEVDIGMDEYTTTVYCWYDETGIANCNITIQGGKVVAKSQVGLK